MLRLFAPQCATYAHPGTQVRLSYNGTLPHTVALLRVEEHAGWIEILYPVASDLPTLNTGELITLSIVPGAVFTLPSRPYPVIIGDTAGTAPTVFMANRLRQQKTYWPLILLGYDTAPPFTAAPSRILVQGMPSGVIAAMPLLEDWGIPSRIAHTQGRPGCFEGAVEELACLWLDGLSNIQQAEIEIIVSGSSDLTNAVAGFARQYSMPCQTLALPQ